MHHSGRFGSPAKPGQGHAFLRSGDGTLSSDGQRAASRAKECSPQRPRTPSRGVRGRLSPLSATSLNSFRREPSPSAQKIRKRAAAASAAASATPSRNNDDPAVQQALSHVKVLVMQLVDLQQRLQDPSFQSPEAQRRLTEQLFTVRGQLLEAQPGGAL